MNEKYTSHLPLTPRTGNNPKKPLFLGYLTIPTIASHYREQYGLHFALALDDTRIEESQRSNENSNFMMILSKMGIHFDSSYSSDTEKVHDTLKMFIKTGIKEGWIVQDNVSVMTCYSNDNSDNCGKCEYLYIPGMKLRSSSSHAISENGKCTICNRELTLQNVDALLWSIGDEAEKKSLILSKVSPEFGQKEILDQWEHLKNTRLLISRQRKTLFNLDVSEKQYYLDPDLVNYLGTIIGNNSESALYLSSGGFIRVTLLTLMAELMVNNNIISGDTVILPRVNIKSSIPNDERLKLSSYIELDNRSGTDNNNVNDTKIPPEILRLILLSANASEKKELNVDITKISYIQRAIIRFRRSGLKIDSAQDISISESLKLNYSDALNTLISKLQSMKSYTTLMDLNLTRAEKFLLQSLIDKV